MRSKFNTLATQKRLGAYSSNKATFASQGSGVLGYFTPIEPSQKTESAGIMTQAYEFTVDGWEDILVNDILTIESVEYGVKGVSRYKTSRIDILRCLLVEIANG